MKEIALCEGLERVTEQDFAKSSLTPRGKEQHHREYYKIDNLSVQGFAARLKDELAKELAAKEAELTKHQGGAYEHMKSTVSAYSDQLQGIIGCLQSDIEKLKVFEQATAVMHISPSMAAAASAATEEAPDSFIETYSNGSSSIIRYGINAALVEDAISKSMLVVAAAKGGSVKSGGARSEAFRDESLIKVLHPIEVSLIREALASRETTVLVDIFEREANGSIALKGKDVQTHTVVLHKQGEQVLLIDPTNSEHSLHLALGINKLLIGKSLVAPEKRLEVYTPEKDNTGSSAEQTRDCVDIATKIALQLKMGTPELVLTVQNPMDAWKAWEPLIAISNRLDKDLPKECAAPFDEGKSVVALRIKQSSDDSVRNEFAQLNDKIQNLFRISKLIKVTTTPQGLELLQEEYKKVETTLKEVLSEPYDHTNYADLQTNLLGVYDCLYEYTTKLLGMQYSVFHPSGDGSEE